MPRTATRAASCRSDPLTRRADARAACHPVPRASSGRRQRGPDPGRHPLRGRAHADGPAAARPPPHRGRAAGDGRAHRHRRRASAGWRRCGSSARCWRRPASRSTTRGSCPSCRRRPTEAATLFDLVVGAGGMFGGTWLESSGAVFAENEALRWLADLAGLPPSAGGVFVSGGSAGNLSALVAARSRLAARRPRTGTPSGRSSWPPTGAHSSVVRGAGDGRRRARGRGRTSGAGPTARRSRPAWPRSTAERP